MSTTKTTNTKFFLEMFVADYPKLKIHQQQVVKENLSVSGADGRLWVQPLSSSGYDVSLSGQSLSRLLTAKMKSLFGEIHGFKQTRPENHQPYWRVAKLGDVCKAIEAYAETANDHCLGPSDPLQQAIGGRH